MAASTIPHSASVQNASERLAGGERIDAWPLVREILHDHPEYAGRMGGKLTGESGPEAGGEHKSVDEWLQELNALFDPAVVQRIDGRLAIWGLSRLDSALKQYLDSFGFLAELEKEIEKEMDSPVEKSLRATPPPPANEPPQTPEAVFALALRMAEALAVQVRPPLEDGADSVFLFAALVWLGVSAKAPGPGPELKAALAVPGQSNIASLAPEHSVVQALGLDTAYGITAFPASVDPNRPAAPHAPEVDALIAAAGRVHAQASQGSLSDLHLFGALLAPRMIEPSPRLHAYLRTGGRSLAAPRRALLDFVRQRPGSERIEVWERLFAAPDYLPPVAGYITDSASELAPDLLDVEREVANIAHVLTFKQVQPPLALGLFGDWGSGKTFFMGKLRRRIGQIADYYAAEEKTSGQEALWCSRVAQIDFNAWHFSDANLWASLVTRIYEGLDRELRGEKETADELKKRILEAQLEQAREKARLAESQLDQAKARVTAAETTLKEKRQQREKEESRLRSLISSISELLTDAQSRKRLERAAKALGAPEAAKSFEALEALDGELKSLSGRATAITLDVLHSPWTLGLMALAVLVLPVAVAFAVERWAGWLGAIGQRVAEISGFLLSVVVWLQAQVRRGLGLVKDVETGLQQAREMRQKKIETSEDVRRARQTLTEAQVEEQAARTNLASAQTELQRLQQELQELRPERKLQRLIEERASSGAYSQHLGIISLIRADFENMSRLLVEMAEERKDFQKDPPPIQRIVLYIDDLDRCRPERVVEVLEAVHLLLFFPLFVVVVAVDPRWLRHSLAEHYPATLPQAGRIVLLDGRAGTSLYSTPQDYLEKIFQIPFALRPVEKGGYQSLVTDLLKPLPPRKQRTKAPAAAAPTPAVPTGEGGAPQVTAGGDGSAAQGGQASTTPPPPAQAGPGEAAEETSAETGYTPIPPRQLDFTEWEKTDIQRLWPLFRTPRTVKRFINIYRLVRAGLASDEDVTAFTGAHDSPGHYQVALLLLASVTAFPNEAERFLYRLDDWLEQEAVQAQEQRRWDWKDVVQFLQVERESGKEERPTTGKASPAPKGRGARAGGKERATVARRQPVQSKQNRPTGKNGGESLPAEDDEEQEQETSWALLLDCLDSLTREGAWESFESGTLRTWAARVARFSFSVHPAHVLESLEQ